MRLIVVLLSLLIVGLLVYRQLEGNPPRTGGKAGESERVGAPRIPTNPDQLPAFEQQVNDYVEDQAAERARAVEEAAAARGG